MAKVVNGPIAIRVMVSAGFSLRMRRISWAEWRLDGVNNLGWYTGSVCAALTAVEESSVAAGGASKRWDQASEGLVWCGCF